MKVVFAEGIEVIVDTMDMWWRSNRLSAPHLFTQELAEALERIVEQPDRFPAYKETQRGTVRRVLMPRTRNHVYYVHRPNEDLVIIVSVWGGPRGSHPKLD